MAKSRPKKPIVKQAASSPVPAPDDDRDEFTPAPVPECVTPVALPVPLVETATPTPEPPVISDQTVPMTVDNGARISAGKLLARRCGLTPAAGQARAQLLDDDTVRAVLALQLDPDAAPKLRALCGL